MSKHVWQQCVNAKCREKFPVDKPMLCCPKCGSLLDVRYDWKSLPRFNWRKAEARVAKPGHDHRESDLNLSGVWRFRDLLPFYQNYDQIVTMAEGRTICQHNPRIAEDIGLTSGELYLQYEGYNPTGSFKDNGMTAGFTHAKRVGAKKVACASTGNTSASMAMYAAAAGMQAYVFIGSGKIAYGKLSQALDYGATTLQVKGDFDACLNRVRQVAGDVPQMGIYLMNSLNPFRLEGQKTIIYRILERLGWNVPDWIIVPGGNLGNSSAFGKAFFELAQLGLINKMPRLAIVQAKGADPLYELWNDGLRWNKGHWDQAKIDAYMAQRFADGRRAKTIASAIEIGQPVNLTKAIRALEFMDGTVIEVEDKTILEYKALIGQKGYGCEPASAASVAGAKQLIDSGVIAPGETVACVLTGHQLKDPDATVKYHTGIDMKAVQDEAPQSETDGCISNHPIQVDDDLPAILEAMGGDPAWAEQVAV